MQLWLSVEAPPAEPRDVTANLDSSTPTRDFVHALGRHLGLDGDDPDARLSGYCERLECWFGDQGDVGSLGLRQGDTILLRRRRAGDDHSRAQSGSSDHPVFDLVVVGGPRAGTRRQLAPGAYVVGRSAECEIALDDPSLSRSHVRVRVADNRVHVSDAGSTNGTFVDGERLVAEVVVATGQVVQAGRSLITFESSQSAAAGLETDQDGFIPFNRPPRIARPFQAPTLELQAPPDEPQKPRLPIGASLVPLISGLGLLAVTKSPYSLVLAGLSPVMAIWTYVESRRGGAKDFERRKQDFSQKLSELARQMDAASSLEVKARRDGAPDAPGLLRRVTSQLQNLWERRPDDADFLVLRIGSAPQASDVRVVFGSGGSEELRREAYSFLTKHSNLPSVPLTVRLASVGAVGLSGERGRVAALARWLILQAAILHSPRDLIISAGVSGENLSDWEWLKWLPNARQQASLAGPLLASEPEDVQQMFQALLDLVRERRDMRRGLVGQTAPSSVLVLIDQALAFDRARLSELLEGAAASGIGVIWLGNDVRDLPGECTTIVELDQEVAKLSLTDVRTGVKIHDVTADGLTVEIAREMARALAPIRDTSAKGETSQIPTQVSLLELLAMRPPSPDRIAARWRLGTAAVAAPIGATVGGRPFSVDLRRDGPHLLIAGMTGSGKSELLQSLVASFAATHPPSRLSFLLVDYKGGAAFKDCVDLPHTVGSVTDLDEQLARRALASLNAEIKRREGVLRQAGVKSLAALESRGQQTPFPNLLIVIDEFATLATEIPEFVAGIVDVAQRGRSLGLHLALSTQRPAGVVTPNIRANTNLRIALRVGDLPDSEDVIGAPDAARIPVSLPGRAFARIGQGKVQEFQAAYAGNASLDSTAIALSVEDLHFGSSTADDHRDTAQNGDVSTDLRRLVDATMRAAETEGIVRQPSPWLPALPTIIPLAELADRSKALQPAGAPLGLLDEPRHQRQRLFTFDLSADGSALVFGAGGSGKTELLRTLACSLAQRNSPNQLHIYGLDFATRGLSPLEALPQCGSVINAEDEERIIRLFFMLQKTVAKRMDAMGRHKGSDLEQPADVTSAAFPQILVLIDGYAGFAAKFDRFNFGELVDTLPRLVADGRSLGVHFVITADRRGAVPGSLAGIIHSKIVLRMADTDEYSALGIDAQTWRGALLPAGRGFLLDGTLIQFAICEPNPNQAVEYIERLGAELRSRHGSDVAPHVQRLPATISRAVLAEGEQMRPVIGLSGDELLPVSAAIDGHFLVVGGHRSGRTTALATLASALSVGPEPPELHLLAPKRSALLDLQCWSSAARGQDECDKAAQGLVEKMRSRQPHAQHRPIVIVVDDGEDLLDVAASPRLEAIVRGGVEVGIFVLAAADSQSAHHAFGGWMRELRKSRSGLILDPDVSVDGELFGITLPRKARTLFPPGRGYLVQRGGASLIQVAS